MLRDFTKSFNVVNLGTVVAPIPIFHMYGLSSILLLAIAYGSTVVFMPKFSVDLLFKTIQEYKVNRLPAVPTLLMGLLKMPLEKYDLSSLSWVTVGAAPLRAELQKTISKKLRIPISQGYGMTELPGVAVMDKMGAEKAGSVGVLIPNVEAKVISPIDGRLLGPNEDGELCFRCPNMMTGYLNDLEATQNTIDHDGFLHTGDMGHFDDDGYMFIVDRLKELIKYKGYQIAPAELESVLMSHHSVLEAAVVGRHDVEDGELPTAFVVKKPDHDVSTHELIQYVANKVAPYKRIRGGVIFAGALPRTPTGKILRRQLTAKLIQLENSKL